MSSLLIYLSTPAEYPTPPSNPWSTLHVPPSAHDIKPFLAFLREQLAVKEEYGFKLSVIQRSIEVKPDTPSPIGDADLKPITSVSEFQQLFETLEWQEGAGITLVAELKKKETPAAAPAASSSAPKFQAPSKATAKPIVATPAYVPITSANTSTLATPIEAAPFVPPPSAPVVQTYAQLNRFNQEGAKKDDAVAAGNAGAAASSVANRLAMFGGASIAASNRINNPSAPVSSSSSASVSKYASPTPAATTAAPTPVVVSTSTVIPSQPLQLQVVQVAAPVPLVASVQHLPTPLTAQKVDLSKSLQTLSFTQAQPVVASVNLSDPDLDLPAPPSGFSDPFLPPPPAAPSSSSSSIHPPLPQPPLPQPPLPQPPLPTPPFQLSVAKIIPPPPTVPYDGDGPSDDSDLPPRPVSLSVASISQPAPPANNNPLAALSPFLANLKANQAQLAFLFATDKFQEMIGLAESQLSLYDSELNSGLIERDSGEHQRAQVGVLLYLFHLGLARATLQDFGGMVSTGEKFEAVFRVLPAALQAEPNQKRMLLRLRYNAGVAQEKRGDVQAALEWFNKAANAFDAASDAFPLEATSSPAAVGYESEASADLRADLFSALGNLFTACRQFEQAVSFHDRAVRIEDSFTPKKRWHIFHAAASCFAQKTEYAKAIELDSRAIALTQQHPRLFFNRGLCHQKLNNFQASLSDFTQVVELDPVSMPKAFVLRAKALMHDPSPQWQAVVDDCQRALKLTPADVQAREFLQFAQNQLLQGK